MAEEKIPLEVIIDTREPIDFYHFFDNFQYQENKKEKSKYIIEVKREKLEVGDYLINKQALVERKTALDFVSSVKKPDGTNIFDQIDAMNANADPEHCYLVIEKPLETIRQWTHFSVNAAYGVYIALAPKCIPIIVRNKQAMKSFLKYLLFRYAPDRTPGGKTIRPKKPVKSPEEIQLFILAGLPGISEKRGKIILENFNDIGEFVNALQTPEGMEPLNKMFPPKTVNKWSELIWSEKDIKKSNA